jgi:hypothetical protein
MPGYAIQPFDEQSLSELRLFLCRSVEALERSLGFSGDGEFLPANQLASWNDYRWLLDEDNPARQEGIPAGELIRNDQGTIMGMLGFHPEFFD